jgi:hypothetical protein
VSLNYTNNCKINSSYETLEEGSMEKTKGTAVSVISTAVTGSKFHTADKNCHDL